MDQIPPAQLALLRSQNKGPLNIAVCVSFTVLALTFIAMRFFTRIKYLRNVGMEDYIIGIAMFFSLCMGVCQMFQLHYGNGRHLIFLTLPQIINMLKSLYFAIFFYSVSLTLIKISILMQYRRIFTFKEMRLPIYIVMGLCIVYGIENILTGFFTCLPVDAFWNITKRPTARCLDVNALYYANAALNILTDLLIALLPIKGIWQLSMRKAQKIVVLVILTLGWFVCIVSMLRLHFLIILNKHPEDASWYSETAYWSSIEVNLAIVCASAPALKPLVVHFVPRFATGSYPTKQSGLSSTRNTKVKSSFVELKSRKTNQGTVHDDVELGNATGPPSYGSKIQVVTKLEQQYDAADNQSEHGSQKDLFSRNR